MGGGAGAGASGGGLVLLSISPNFSVGSTCIGLTPRIWQGDGTAGIKVALTHLDNLPRPIAPGKAYLNSEYLLTAIRHARRREPPRSGPAA